jgi:TonB family protein
MVAAPSFRLTFRRLKLIGRSALSTYVSRTLPHVMKKNVIVSVIVGLFVASGLAQNQSALWRELLADSATSLKAGDYGRALKRSDRLIAEMVDRLGPGDLEAQAFAIALTHRALAHAGLGNTDDALWYWHAALSLYPALARSDISMFGAPGQFLKTHPARPIESALPVEGARPLGDVEITPPKLLKRVEPQFPPGAKAFAVDGVLIVQVVIEASGRVSSPLILKALPAPTLSYAALEAVKRWRFQPAKIRGEPSPVLFNLTVNYKLR